MCKVCKREYYIFRRLKEVNYGWMKRCEVRKSSNKSWICLRFGNKGFYGCFKVFKFYFKGKGKLLNSFN